MALDLDLNLADMKEMIGWDDSNFQDISTGVPQVLDGYGVRHTRTARLNGVDDVGRVTQGINPHYLRFLIYIGVPNPVSNAGKISTRIISEALANLVIHGGESIGEADTVIEHYHPVYKPADPLEFIVRITNPNAQEWDYKRTLTNQPPTDESGKKHWLSTVKDWNSPLVSYDNNGKNFLALVRAPLD